MFTKAMTYCSGRFKGYVWKENGRGTILERINVKGVNVLEEGHDRKEFFEQSGCEYKDLTEDRIKSNS